MRQASSIGRLLSRVRIWRFGFICRHHPERIGLELRRMLVAYQGPARWARMRQIMLAGRAGASPPGLAAVAAFRWKITDAEEVDRVFASLSEAQQDRIYAAVNFILPGRPG